MYDWSVPPDLSFVLNNESVGVRSLLRWISHLNTEHDPLLLDLLEQENNQACNFICTQECIPVGCVPPAAVPSGGVSTRHPPGSTPHIPPAARHAGIPPAMHAEIAPPCCKACWDTTCNACWDTTPSLNRMTNRCKNITLPQTSFAGGKDEAFYFCRQLAHLFKTSLQGVSVSACCGMSFA